MIFGHRHAFEAVAVENKPQGPRPIIPATVLPINTVILWRCGCNMVMSTWVDGRWTLQQIRGEAPKPLESTEASALAAAAAGA